MKNKNIFVIILLLVIAVLAYFVFSKNTVAPIVQNEPTPSEQSVKETYTYTNHGFSIELPKNIVPREVTNARGNATEIFIGDSLMTYVTDINVWENNLAKFEYKGEEKIGGTIFKVYYNKYTEGTIYWFKQGKVGYSFSGDKELLITFKFVGWPQVTGNKEDLILFSIKPGQEVSSKMTATGSIKGAYFFEANIGINVLDANKKLLRAGSGMATTDWMTSGPVTFTTNLDFTGLPQGSAFIEIHNDNASGLPENDKSILIPVVIK